MLREKQVAPQHALQNGSDLQIVLAELNRQRFDEVIGHPRLVEEIEADQLANDKARAGIPCQDEVDSLLQKWVVAEAMTRLSTDHREVLRECYVEGRSVADAARRLGVPEGTVKSRTHYALRALRLALEEMGVTG